MTLRRLDLGALGRYFGAVLAVARGLGYACESCFCRGLVRGDNVGSAAVTRIGQCLLALTALVSSQITYVAHGRAAEQVDLLLALAMDVSRSMEQPKFLLQREGYAAAITAVVEPGTGSLGQISRHRHYRLIPKRIMSLVRPCLVTPSS